MRCQRDKLFQISLCAEQTSEARAKKTGFPAREQGRDCIGQEKRNSELFVFKISLCSFSSRISLFFRNGILAGELPANLSFLPYTPTSPYFPALLDKMAFNAHDYPPASNVIGLASTSSTSVQITDLVGAATAAYSQSLSLSDSSHSGSPSSHRSNSCPRPSRDESPPHSGPGVATFVRRPTKAQLVRSTSSAALPAISDFPYFPFVFLAENLFVCLPLEAILHSRWYQRLHQRRWQRGRGTLGVCRPARGKRFERILFDHVNSVSV